MIVPVTTINIDGEVWGYVLTYADDLDVYKDKHRRVIVDRGTGKVTHRYSINPFKEVKND